MRRCGGAARRASAAGTTATWGATSRLDGAPSSPPITCRHTFNCACKACAWLRQRRVAPAPALSATSTPHNVRPPHSTQSCRCSPCCCCCSEDNLCARQLCHLIGADSAVCCAGRDVERACSSRSAAATLSGRVLGASHRCRGWAGASGSATGARPDRTLERAARSGGRCCLQSCTCACGVRLRRAQGTRAERVRHSTLHSVPFRYRSAAP